MFLIGSPVFWFYYERFENSGISILWFFGVGLIGAYLIRRLGNIVIKHINFLLNISRR